MGDLSNIKVVFTDVDGVLTDGGLFIGPQGEAIKRFHAHDGHGMKLLVRNGIEVVWVTARISEINQYRANELGVTHIMQNVQDKATAIQAYLSDKGYDANSAIYIGDDVFDVEAFGVVRFGVAPANAVDAVKEAATIVLQRSGGDGAFRELAEEVLRQNNK